MKTKTCSSPSIDVVHFLHGKGKTFKSIGKLLGVGESYISRVARGQRKFTIDHLQRLAKELDKSLPELLLLATPMDAVPRSLRSNYKLLLKALGTSERLQASLAEAEGEKLVKMAK
jgi:transcriptional regulator with XRE-family HTH domain